MSIIDPVKKAQYNKRYRERHRREKTHIPTATFSMRLPTVTIARLQQIAAENISTGRHPWKTTQEVAKALLDRGFVSLKDDMECVNEFMPQFEMEQDLAAVARARQQSQSMLTMAKTNIKAFLELGSAEAEKEAKMSFSSALYQARRLPVTVFSIWLIDELRKSFPDFATMDDAGETPKASLATRHPREHPIDRREREDRRRGDGRKR